MPTSDETGYFVHPSAIVDEPCEVGAGTKIWHFSHVMSGCRIGESCSLGQNCFVGSGVIIGRNVKIQNNVSIYEGVELEDDVFCGPSMVFTNVLNPRSEIVRKGQYRPTVVRHGATIGANATIVCGHEIGEYAFIGAGAVVTEDVVPHSLMLGVPARDCAWASRYGHRLEFDDEGTARCPESGEEYILVDDDSVRQVDHPSAHSAVSRKVILNKTNAKATRNVVRCDAHSVRPIEANWWSRFTRRSSISNIVLAASIAYYLLLCWVLISPSPLSHLPDTVHRILRALDLKDYYHLGLFIPVGFLAASRWVCAGGWLDLTAALSFATGSEVAQVFVRSRDAQAIDLLQNVCGIAIGVAAVGIILSFVLMSQRNVLSESRWVRD